MLSDQQLYDRAWQYLQMQLETSENYDETLRYFYFLRESIDHYMASLQEGGEDYLGS